MLRKEKKTGKVRALTEPRVTFANPIVHREGLPLRPKRHSTGSMKSWAREASVSQLTNRH